METLKRILLCLDGTEMDKEVLRYTSFISKIIKPEKIYFLHVASSLDIPADIKEKYPDLLAPLDETIEKILDQSITENFDFKDCETEIEVREGNATAEILKFSRQKEVDLMVFGKKENEGDGVLPGKLAKLAGCSLLFVSEGSALKLDKIFVPTDFSESSAQVMSMVQPLVQSCEASLMAQHTYTVPKGYYKTGKSFEEFAEIMKGHAQIDKKKFVEKNKLKDFECIYSLDKKGTSTARITYDEIEKYNPDLIIMGSKGRTDAAGWIMGSVADKMTRIHHPFNLMVIKNRSENLSFIDALMKI